MQNKVVIGANFGDEGKGLMTDYFVSQFKGDCMVVRFNGGSQAGHTVVTPEGRRHVFSHFGAGSLAGASTYLSRFFLVNPLTFLKEQKEIGFAPLVYVDDECLITTPYDMHINQLSEALKGDKRHGSCGIGINETIKRSEQEEFCLKVKDFCSNTWGKKLFVIATEYYTERLAELKVPNPYFNHRLFFEAFQEFGRMVMICDPEILKGKNLVFEGAQGLLLDQNHHYFPHVTRGNTGFKNVAELLTEWDREEDDTEVTYVTRSYMTRHGRGPFPTEMEGLPYPNVVDDTNVDHEFQESLRFGLLDLPALTGRIAREMTRFGQEKTSIAVTCLDQIDEGMVNYFPDNYSPLVRASEETFLRALSYRLPFWKVYTSYGKTRKTIKERRLA